MTADTEPRLRPIGELNGLSRANFVTELRPLFEAADPLAAALYAERPFASYAELIDRAEALVERMPIADRVDVVNAHPRIGASAEAVRQVSSLSYREQGYSAEAQLPPEEVERVYAALAELNHEYETRFGFRFVVFVNRRPKAAILEVLRERLHGSRDHELQTGLREMFLIARDRLRTLNAGT